MVHCCFEGTAVTETVKNPLKSFAVSMFGVNTKKPFAPEIDLTRQRPADFVFSTHVEKKLAEIQASNPRAKKTARVI
jgi:hypothetical protein